MYYCVYFWKIVHKKQYNFIDNLPTLQNGTHFIYFWQKQKNESDQEYKIVKIIEFSINTFMTK